ncbi:hypothetical protein ACLBYG_22485 [Methylobacterium sp. D53M]
MTQADMLARLRALLPPWFPDDDPILDGLLSGIAALLVFVLGLIAFAKLQTRVMSATGAFLDLAAFDLFGAQFRRRMNEPDASFQLRVRKEVFRPRNTRAAITQAVTDLTGIAPELREPWNPGDNGAWNRRMAYAGVAQAAVRVSGYNAARSRYGRGTFAYATPRAASGGSVGAGHWGSLDMRNQILVRVRRGGGGVVTVGPCGAYNTGRMTWGGSPNASGGKSPGRGFYVDSAGQERVTDAEIYATIAQTVAAGTIAWTHIDP